MIKIYVCILIACFLAFDAEAADNDDLAFTFISSVDECAEAGIYTAEQAAKVKAEQPIETGTDNLADFCQQVYDEKYPRDYDANRVIRSKVQ